MKASVIGIIFLVQASLSFCQTNVVPDDQEFQALKALYDSLGGATWTTKTNWPTPGNWPATATAAQMGTWYGVIVTNGDVTQVAYTGNNITGKIPLAITNLKALKTLQFYGTAISGSIPQFLNQMTSLVSLNLGSQATLSGPIPDLSSLTSLTLLSFRNCSGLTAGPIPVWITSSTQLVFLDLNGTHRTGSIPESIGNLVNLAQLDLSGNQLTGSIPSTIGNLTKLQNFLYLNGNQLSGSIPATIGNLTNLSNLNLGSNQLTGNLPDLSNLQMLQILNLGNNKISGTIPGVLGNLTNLTQLYLNNNQLSGEIPSQLGGLSKLTTLYLHTNSLTGSIPSSLGSLGKLMYMYMENNQFTGSIPPSLGNLTSLYGLWLSGNKLTGSIPSSLGNLSNLGILYLYDNKLSGSIPAEIGNLKKLVTLNLATNQLSGSIPLEIGNLNSLTGLYIQSNQLTGSIPTGIGNLTNLVYLYLSGNQLSGELPSSLGNLSKLQYFIVNNNQFTGTLPSSLSNWTQLYAIYIYANKFSGPLPDNFFSTWTKLGLADISSNNFSGAFPSSIGNCSSLTYLNGGTNLFTTLPSSMLNLPIVSTMYFDANELNSIPGFATQINKANLNLKLNNNRLDFTVLEPLVGAGIKSATITPQKTINDVTTQTLSVGADLLFTARTRGSYTSNLKWEKLQPGNTWLDISSSNADALTGNTYRIANATTNAEGTYRWSCTSTKATGVTLMSDPIPVKTPQRFTMDNFGFQYKYDGRRRMIQKKVPGADWVYMVYDKRDRLVLTQDGNQRLSNQWTFTKYDALNRPVSTGIYSPGSFIDQATMQGNVDNYYDPSKMTSSQAWYESFSTATGNVHNYDNKSFPQVTDPSQYLTITYYDNYAFISSDEASIYQYFPNDIASQTVGSATYNQPSSYFTSVTGHVTGIKTRVLDTYTYWLKTVNYYDDKYRIVQTIADNQRIGQERITNVFDFTGKTLATNSTLVSQVWTWQNIVNSKVVGDKYISPTSTGWGTSGGSSVQQLASNIDGWMETTVVPLTDNNNNQVASGLSQIDADANWTSINYCWRQMSQAAYIYENGVQKTGGFVTFPGDVLRIERNGAVVKYKKNGAVVYTSSVPSSSSLVCDVALYSKYSVLLNLRSSFSLSTSTRVSRMLDYDHAGRLLKTWHSVNGATPVLLAQNEYNEIGQLVDKKLYSDNGSTFKQSTDYRYNIRGWLTSINNSQLANDQLTNDDTKDLFGMNLSYNDVVSGINNAPQFNGNISAMRWSNNLALGSIKDVGYSYTYDTLNRIKSASYLTNSGAWGATNNFAEKGFCYDLNGNIKKLTRTNASSMVMDQLKYDYSGQGGASNQLKSVTDSGDLLSGFTDGNTVGNDYIYDANGNMTADKNKNITAITYNHLNLPQQVTKSTGEKIVYSYDAGGRKLRQQVYNASNVLTKATDYTGEFIYQNDTLQFINHEEGRVVMKNTATPEYQYHLKDHLGNVRLTFTTKNEVEANTATFEPANQNVEQSKFLRYDDARLINSTLFDHTHNGTTAYSERLSGSSNEKTGIARSISVMPGDTIKMEVFAKYVDGSNSNNTAALTQLLSQIVTGTASAGTVIDGAAYSTNGASVFPFIGLAGEGNDTGVGPKAYLNYIMFDRNYNPIVTDASQTNFVRMSTAGKEDGTNLPNGNLHERLYAQVVVKQAGYMYIYLSNENPSPVEVYFDDFKVTQTKSPVVQQEDFYPFGLKFNSYSRENTVPNTMKLFQNQEHIDDLGLNWDSFKWRNHMPEIGRFFNVDPLASQYVYNSPYAFSENQVTRYIELEGLEAADPQTKEPVKQQEQQKQQEEPNFLVKGIASFLGLIQLLGDTHNQMTGNEDENGMVTGVNLINDIVMGIQAHGEILKPSGEAASVANKVDDVASKTKTVANEAKVVSKEVSTAASFIVDTKGTAYPVPKGAKGSTQIVDGGKVKGTIFTGGKGGANGQVSSMRIMNPIPARGNAPAYPGGYIKYENAQGQGVNPYTGRTASKAETHYPLPILNDY